MKHCVDLCDWVLVECLTLLYLDLEKTRARGLDDRAHELHLDLTHTTRVQRDQGTLGNVMARESSRNKDCVA
jgi:hypothetical protein